MEYDRFEPHPEVLGPDVREELEDRLKFPFRAKYLVPFTGVFSIFNDLELVVDSGGKGFIPKTMEYLMCQTGSCLATGVLLAEGARYLGFPI
ncbi:MAG: hypothetical protein KJ879_01490 [Nanoarchaeota archaeon]|nr:hypothetical protein [Nanoarchaeota archaeon]